MDITALRADIDKVDKELVKLYTKRMELAARIGEYKKQNGIDIYDQKREQEKLKEVKQLAGDKYSAQAAELYSLLFSQSRKLQQGINEAE